MKLLFACLLLPCGVAATHCAAQTCTTSATANAFGVYQPLSGSAANTTATVGVTCNPGALSILVSYTLQLGTGASGSFSGRTMTNGTAHLTYQLYRDVLDTQVWGDGTGGSYSVTDGYTLGIILPVSRTYTAYGRITANQNVPIGAYGDTVMVLLSY